MNLTMCTLEATHLEKVGLTYNFQVHKSFMRTSRQYDVFFFKLYKIYTGAFHSEVNGLSLYDE